jgi:hypothetical protein
MPLLTSVNSIKLRTLLIHQRINLMNRIDLFSRLQKCHDDQIIGVEELAVQLNTTASVVYKIHSQTPEKLPPRLLVFGRKLCWRLGTCREWIRALEAVQLGVDSKTSSRQVALKGCDSTDSAIANQPRIPIGRPRAERSRL